MSMNTQDAAHATRCAEAAVRYADALGWRILHTHGIVGPSRVCTCYQGAECTRPGKHPDGPNFTAKATTDAATLRSRYNLVPFNCALLIPDDVLVLDCDTLGALQHLAGVTGGLPSGPIVQTRRGAHLYFRWSGATPSPSIPALDGHALDVLGSGSLVTLPPSRSPSGAVYRWREGLSPFDGPLPAIPPALGARLERVARRRAARRVLPVALTTETGALAFARQRATRARVASNGAARGEYGVLRTLEDAGAPEAVRDAAVAAFREGVR